VTPLTRGPKRGIIDAGGRVLDLELTQRAAKELRKRGGVAAIDFVPAIA
jgi:hypothetical protein